jgi:polyhydroxyalkanoate synthase
MSTRPAVVTRIRRAPRAVGTAVPFAAVQATSDPAPLAVQQRASGSPSLVGLPFERDSYAATAFSDVLDRSVHAAVARMTGGLSPAALTQAYADWAIHLAAAPGKQAQLVQKGLKKGARLARYLSDCAVNPQETGRCIEPLAHDRRFEGAGWQQWPFNAIHQGFLLQQQWWHNATTGLRGVTARHENLVQFMARQLLDMFSPSNFPLTNPDALNRTVKEGGMNLLRGLRHMAEDWERDIAGKPPVGSATG